MMTREDMLRELELLPVWQLRVPVAEIATHVSINQVATQETPVSKAVELPIFSHIASVDGQWLFVLENQPLSEEESQLLRNIFRAMRIQTKSAEPQAYTANTIAALQPACIVAMGEAVTQAMLSTSEPLENLRGKIHIHAGVKLAPTYDVKYLLQHLPSKAKAWHDLCVAMQALQEVNTDT